MKIQISILILILALMVSGCYTIPSQITNTSTAPQFTTESAATEPPIGAWDQIDEHLKIYTFGKTDISLFEEEHAYLIGLDPRRGSRGWSSMANLYFRGLPFTFTLTDHALEGYSITWEVSVQDGYFNMAMEDSPIIKNSSGLESPSQKWGDIFIGQSAEIENRKSLHWHNTPFVDDAPEIFEGELTYMDAIAKAGEHIVGYVAIVITSGPTAENFSPMYGAFLQKSEYFPPVDGIFQDITLEYVHSRIAAARADESSITNQYLISVWGDPDTIKNHN